MVRKAFFLVAGISAALLATSPQADAQRGAPRVRVTFHYSSFSSIAPSVSLSEPSYMLAVAIDRDGQVSVLSPVAPGDIFRFNAEKSLRLPEFFTGFSSTRSGYYDAFGPRYASYIRSLSDDYSTGSVLVIASKTPFNFASISNGPFWNEEAIKKLVRYRDPASAVYALGRAVTAKGQSFGHDYQRFGATQFRIASADPCFGFGMSDNYRGSYWGFGSGYLPTNSYIILPASGLRVGYQLTRFGTDECGRPRYVVVPVVIAPATTPDTLAADSVNIPKPTTKSVIAAAPGTYSGEEAVRVFEMVKNRNNSDGYVGLPMNPILKDKDEGQFARPVSRGGAAPERVETFERVNSARATPIERAPVLRQEEPRYSAPVSQPIMRTEPVSQSAPTVQREAHNAEVVSRPKDN